MITTKSDNGYFHTENVLLQLTQSKNVLLQLHPIHHCLNGLIIPECQMHVNGKHSPGSLLIT